MIQIRPSDFEIKIGIKDGKINEINWIDAILRHPEINLNAKSIISFLKDAIKSLKKLEGIR